MEENACHSKTMEGKKIDLIVQNQLYIYTQQTPIYIYILFHVTLFGPEVDAPEAIKQLGRAKTKKRARGRGWKRWKRRGAEEEIRRRPR